MSTIGQRLRHARQFRGLSAEQLDQLAGLEHGTAARIEAAARANRYHAPAIAKLAVALDVRAEWLQRDRAGEGVQITPDNCVELIPHQHRMVWGQPAVWLAGPEMHPEQVVGTGSYRNNLMKILGQNLNPTATQPAPYAAWLLPEPQNPHDPNAVCVSIGELEVGYLARDRAGSWQPLLLALRRRYGRHAATRAEIYRGRDDDDGAPYYRIDLAVPVALPSVVRL